MYIAGEILYPGTYAIRERGERLSSLLKRAGGPTTSSFFEGGRYFRENRRVAVDIGKAYEGDNENDIVVLSGDSLFVPGKPRTVYISGEVNRPGLFSFIGGDAVSDYIDRAGGTTDSSSYAVLTKPSGESRRVNFGFLRSNPSVPEGSSIYVNKMQPEPEAKPVDVGGTIKDIFAIAVSAATIVFLVIQTKK